MLLYRCWIWVWFLHFKAAKSCCITHFQLIFTLNTLFLFFINHLQFVFTYIILSIVLSLKSYFDRATFALTGVIFDQENLCFYCPLQIQFQWPKLTCNRIWAVYCCLHTEVWVIYFIYLFVCLFSKSDIISIHKILKSVQIEWLNWMIEGAVLSIYLNNVSFQLYNRFTSRQFFGFNNVALTNTIKHVLGNCSFLHPVCLVFQFYNHLQVKLQHLQLFNIQCHYTCSGYFSYKKLKYCSFCVSWVLW